MRLCREKLKLNIKPDNRGAALVSVLVVATFITIIATTMLYISTMNYRQKQVDYQNKQSFYGAEKALDEFKSLLVQDVQDAYVEAYKETSKNFLWKESERSDYFQETFMDTLNEKWEERMDSVTPDNLTEMPLLSDTIMNGNQIRLLCSIQQMMKKKAAETGVTEYSDSAECFYKVDSYGVYKDSGKKKFALKGIQVKCTVGSYTTFLYTDICLEPPNVKWANNYTSADTNAEGTPVKTDIEKFAFTDYVYYINWHRADYDERNTYKTNIGKSESGIGEPESDIGEPESDIGEPE